MPWELALQETDATWSHCGDFDTRAEAVGAAGEVARDRFARDPHLRLVVFGLSDDPHSGHYEDRIEFHAPFS